MFYEGKRLGAEGWKWLKIHTANLFGKDKLSFEERAQFVEGEIPNILDSANNPLGGRRWWLQAEHPWQVPKISHFPRKLNFSSVLALVLKLRKHWP